MSLLESAAKLATPKLHLCASCKQVPIFENRMLCEKCLSEYQANRRMAMEAENRRVRDEEQADSFCWLLKFIGIATAIFSLVLRFEIARLK